MIEYEKLILDAVDGGIVVLDKELNILCWNGWLEMVTGIKKESALGQKIYDVVEIEDERLNIQIKFNLSRNILQQNTTIIYFLCRAPRKQQTSLKGAINDTP